MNPAPGIEEIDRIGAILDTIVFDGPVELEPFEVVVDPTLMVKTHMGILRSKAGRRGYLPYFDRLTKLIDKMSVKQ